MGRAQTVAGEVLRVALIVVGVGVTGYIALMVVLFYSLQEPYPFLDVRNESGRPLLVERADVVRSPGVEGSALLAWRTKEGWYGGGDGCEQQQLVARDLQGTVVARRTGACTSDTWTITGEGMSAAPRYQHEPAAPDDVEARLVLQSYGTEDSVTKWWRALPTTLERAAAEGREAGVSVHGPFVEGRDLTMYVRGADPATVLEFARTQVMRPSPGRVFAYVSAPGQPAPQTGTPVQLDATTAPTTGTR